MLFTIIIFVISLILFVVLFVYLFKVARNMLTFVLISYDVVSIILVVGLIAITYLTVVGFGILLLLEWYEWIQLFG